MRLKALLSGVALLGGFTDEDVEISGISYDTRTIQPGELFVALTGYKTDGHRFLREAVEKGAAAVICHKAPEEPGPWLIAADTRAALAAVSANWFGRPADALTVIGVTGTNGKTTTTYLLKAMLEGVLGAKVGLMGTNQNMIGEEVIPAHRTTPESWEVQKLLRDMANRGCTHVVMEVSSHALALHRVDGISFKVGIFTNLTRDHLDFHGTMEEYRRVKGLLFRQTGTAVLNLDDEAGRYYASIVTCPALTYSENKDQADVTAKNIRLFPDRVEFEALTTGAIARVRLPIPGGFTIYNALGVIACGLALKLPLPQVCASLAEAKGVKGRIEVVPTPTDYAVIIDYAHTPDALENILTTVRDFTPGRVICLFGCGGDRDRSKRPVMGAIAAELADLVVLTSDNPRTEDPEAILADIQAGMEGSDTPCMVVPHRREAIRRALDEAKSGDTVVLAGKGHETYQEIGTRRRHLDEREEVAAYFGCQPPYCP
ncbi:MAG: UDP-N-acetylmuramoyl-L-alanyl-D-glutamate--2,6-diaminopimelate ligase [Pseudoflavonifractor capillosus]|uniref:UDP-N-acetylmuramoyl-L-alanyl-D-glutamate--2, 6-diaminopimelate ligase n=1 Tax=Pseudoflavonifractor capillosus TaxID=106588 RepID=UPI0023F69199|nr:UDP-N-acetylmuramoyl-L-alanyl-D-glutamate--2,6-diaminopimelate ligase [Pseudoflavonifractor capillosus]MCI5928879.1 UDP-N-acetylmuramoyl-L-alanyl-D-glutamate--2,6-diaminopimelate ligase [Pseudoflavonifractor capillosus]MDY4660364.1 UDP-N-acetylmuramoyl-L-alanyl-D-glutamate--2,6-diaminopimelate ligase [Pseudoflavonifractor capillosus]